MPSMNRPSTTTPAARARAFCEDYGLRVPIMMAPMAGACPAPLAAAVANAGGMGACGALMMEPQAIADWAGELRASSNGSFALNTWIPGPTPLRDAAHEAVLREFLAGFGPPVPATAGDTARPDFDAQCAAMLAAGPAVISSIMGLYPPAFVEQMKAHGIRWFATVTTVSEALAAEAAGADAVIAQGMEAGGHRGAFDAEHAASRLVGLFSLLPAVVDAVRVPVIATGGIADGRGVAASLVLGAAAVQVGTGLLRSPEAAIAPAWAHAIGRSNPEDTVATRAFSGRLGRAIRSAYTEAAAARDAPSPAPHPVQSGLTQGMRAQAAREDDIDRMQAWAGQSAGLARAAPAGEVVTDMWEEAQRLLGS